MPWSGARPWSRGASPTATLLAEQVAEFEPERIFHLAAQVDVRKAVADPSFDATVNVLGMINLLEAARRLPGASVVFASTGGAIYGEGEDRELPFSEAAEAVPEAAVRRQQAGGRDLPRLLPSAVRGSRRRDAVRQRLRTAAGSARRGRRRGDLLRVAPGGFALRIFGDGRQTRDYVFVGDVVAALLAADAALAERGADIVGPYNVGTGREVDVNELSRRLSEVAGSDAEVEHLPERPGEVRRVCIDASAAERDLGWQAHTDLTDGLRRTYEALASD